MSLHCKYQSEVKATPLTSATSLDIHKTATILTRLLQVIGNLFAKDAAIPTRRHVTWRDSVGVESSGSGLKIRVRGYFASEFSLVVAPY